MRAHARFMSLIKTIAHTLSNANSCLIELIKQKNRVQISLFTDSISTKYCYYGFIGNMVVHFFFVLCMIFLFDTRNIFVRFAKFV